MSRLKCPLVFLFLLLSLHVGTASAAATRVSLPVVAGNVNAMTLLGDRLYIGGAFTFVGPASGGFAVLDPTTGAYLGSPGVVGGVRAILPDGAGGWFLGGTFSSVGGQPRSNLAHVLPSGDVAPWNPGTDGAVTSLALSGSLLYVGGAFGAVSGLPRANLAAVDVTSGAVAPWNPSANSQVDVVVVNGGAVFVGGFFTTVGGQPRNRAAALDAATGLATAWNPDVNNEVRALAIRDTVVYLGGLFSLVGGQSRSRVAAVGIGAGVPTAWAPTVTHTDYHVVPIVSALAVSGTNVYLGGTFNRVAGVARTGGAVVDATTGVVGAWDPNTADVLQILIDGSTAYLTGGFIGVSGQIRPGLAAVDATTGVATAWDPHPSSYAWSVAVAGGRVATGGAFETIAAKPRANLAAVDLGSGAVSDWTADTDEAVHALASSGNTVYAGGHFAVVGGISRLRLAALDASSGAVTTWDPSATGPNPYVYSLAVSGSKIQVGGDFTAIGGQNRASIAEIDSASGLATAWAPEADGAVFALAPSGSAVLAAGNFAHIGGLPRALVAALDPATGSATAWNPGVAGTVVSALAVGNGTIFLGGDFSQVGGVGRSCLAAVNAASGALLEWDPHPTATFPPSVSGLAVASGRLYATGSFTAVGGRAIANFAALDSATGAAMDWDPGLDGPATAVLARPSEVLVGGYFHAAAGQPGRGLAGFVTPESAGVPTPTPTPASLTLRMGPIPSRGAIDFALEIPRAGAVRLAIFDLQGREVTRLLDEAAPEGRMTARWDGLDRGRPAAPGIYLASVEIGGQRVTRRVVVLR